MAEFKVPVHLEDIELQKDDRYFVSNIVVVEDMRAEELDDLLDGMGFINSCYPYPSGLKPAYSRWS